MTTTRYIEVDASNWSDASHETTEPERLFDDLAADGWEVAEARGLRRLFVRRFETESEFRAAVARARFKVAEYLSQRRGAGRLSNS